VVGGSCNDYDYVCGDPVNGFDLDGQRCGFSLKLWARCKLTKNGGKSRLETFKTKLGQVDKLTGEAAALAVAADKAIFCINGKDSNLNSCMTGFLVFAHQNFSGPWDPAGLGIVAAISWMDDEMADLFSCTVGVVNPVYACSMRTITSTASYIADGGSGNWFAVGSPFPYYMPAS